MLEETFVNYSQNEIYLQANQDEIPSVYYIVSTLSYILFVRSKSYYVFCAKMPILKEKQCKTKLSASHLLSKLYEFIKL